MRQHHERSMASGAVAEDNAADPALLPCLLGMRCFQVVLASCLLGSAPVCFVQDDNLVSARRQRHLFLCKHLDLVAHHINASAHTYTQPRVVGGDWPQHLCMLLLHPSHTASVQHCMLLKPCVPTLLCGSMGRHLQVLVAVAIAAATAQAQEVLLVLTCHLRHSAPALHP